MINDVDGSCWEATVSLTDKCTKSFENIKGVQPPYTPEDYEICETVVKTDPKMLEALKKRGSKHSFILAHLLSNL